MSFIRKIEGKDIQYLDQEAEARYEQREMQLRVLLEQIDNMSGGEGSEDEPLGLGA